MTRFPENPPPRGKPAEPPERSSPSHSVQRRDRGVDVYFRDGPCCPLFFGHRRPNCRRCLLNGFSKRKSQNGWRGTAPPIPAAALLSLDRAGGRRRNIVD